MKPHTETSTDLAACEEKARRQRAEYARQVRAQGEDLQGQAQTDEDPREHCADKK